MTTLNTNATRGTLLAALATVGVCDIAFGLTLQLQPLILEQLKVPAWIIGLNAAMGAVGILIAGPFLPAVIAKLGSRRLALIAILMIIATLSAMAVVPPLYWWFPLRFLMGMAVGTLFTVSESWLLTIATDANRGRLMGIYTAMLSLTFAIGPLLLPFTGINGILPWVIGVICVALGLLPLSLVKVREISEDGGKGNIFTVLARAPVLFGCVLAATLFDSVIISFFTIFAVRHGLDLATASTLLATGIIAGVVFFYPIGMLADRWSKNGVVMSCAVCAVASCLALIPLVATPLIWPLVVLLTTSAFGVYVVALALIGDVFKGRDMVAASAAVAAMWGVGGIIGPPIAGRMIDAFGINAFPVTLAGFYCLLVLGLALNRGRVVALPALLQQP